MSVHATETLYCWYKNAHWRNSTEEINTCHCSSINKRAILMLLEVGRSLILRQVKLLRFLSLNVYYKSAKCVHIWCVVILSVSFSNFVFWCHLKTARVVFWRLIRKKQNAALISKTSLAMKSQESVWVSYCKSFQKMGIHRL